jgi:hypothetical protein
MWRSSEVSLKVVWENKMSRFSEADNVNFVELCYFHEHLRNTSVMHKDKEARESANKDIAKEKGGKVVWWRRK